MQDSGFNGLSIKLVAASLANDLGFGQCRSSAQ